MKNPIYLLDHNLKFSIFKKLQDKQVDEEGVYPMNLDKVLWQLMRDQKIYCWFDEEKSGDMCLGFKFPKGRKIILIKNYGK